MGVDMQAYIEEAVWKDQPEHLIWRLHPASMPKALV